LDQKILNPVDPGVRGGYTGLMQEAEALRVMSALAQSTRMNVFVMLVAAGAAGMASSEIADRVGIPRNLMSSHLAVLAKAGVIASTKGGRTVTYTAVEKVALALADYLRGLVA
jgi:predicted transcriptional regulator